MSNLPHRRALQHHVPTWVDENSEWFVTICCLPRGRNQLAVPVAHAILETALAHYGALNRMHVRTWVAMPDHLHLVARFNRHPGMKKTLSGLKHYLATQADVRWQKGFFDHRLRSVKEMEAKCAYVRMNPVRAGLARKPEEWPYRGG